MSLKTSIASERMLLAVSVLAAALPFCLAFQQAPLPAFYSQALSVALWSLVVWLAGLQPGAAPVGRTGRLLIAFWVLLLLTLTSHALFDFSPVFVLAPALLNTGLALLLTLAVLGMAQPQQQPQRPERMQRWLTAVMAGLFLGALLNVLVALMQQYTPGWTNDVWIASREADVQQRATGNLRQPNQLATLLLWGMLAAALLLNGRRMLWLVSSVLMLVTLIATGSRSGMVALVLVVLVALWSWRQRRTTALHLSSVALPYLLCAGLALLLLLAVLSGWFSRDGAEASVSQRLALWGDVLALTRQHLWTGVGFGQLNFAWTLTALPHRAPDVFDHAHSLPLHLAVELGLPVATTLLALLAAVFWRSRSAMHDLPGRLAALLLAVVLLHSLFEYPLWFSYFLLPSAFVLACLVRGATVQTTAAQSVPSSALRHRALQAGAVGLIALVGWALFEYRKVAAIHEHGNQIAELQPVVQRARSSPLYGQFGDYAAIMLAGDQAQLGWFDRPVRNVLDERLLVAYARALARSGQPARASYVAQRAREFPADPVFSALPVPDSAASAPFGPNDFRHLQRLP